MNAAQLTALGLPEDSTEGEIDARLAQLAAVEGQNIKLREAAAGTDGFPHSVPEGIDRGKVIERFKAILAAGPGNREAAARIAIDAECQQAQRDASNAQA